MKAIEPFEIEVPDGMLEDLRQRLKNTRWPVPVQQNEDWDQGTNIAYLEELVNYWINDYDWRRQEARLNRLPQFTAEIDGIDIHFIHQRGKGPDPLPIILTHGWPDSFLRFEKIIPMLTDPAAYGGDPEDSFDVVVPSIPGYGFSDKPEKDGDIFHIHTLWADLMKKTLGYEQFAAHGGDWGGIITEQLARSHSDLLVGIHMTDVPFTHAFQKADNLSADEKKFLADVQEWQKKQGGYNMIQSTRPLTLAAALSDSPAGLAAWLIDKFQAMSDCGGDLEKCFTKDELLTNIMIYWLTDSIHSSFMPYYDIMNAGAVTWIGEKLKEWTGSTAVPAAFALFPKDNNHPPREWAERFFNVQRWTKMKRGGHFTAMEEPELLAADIRAFFHSVRDEASRRRLTRQGAL